MNRPSPWWHATASIFALTLLFAFNQPAFAQIAASPSGMSFGNVVVGTRSTLSGTLINQDSANVTIQRLTNSGSGFSFSGPTLPYTLAPGQSVTFRATFAPTAVGSVTGSFEFTSRTPMYKKHWKGTLKTYVTLSGTGVASAGTLSANPSSLSFGTVTLGASSTKYQTVTNNGGSSITISSATVSSAAFSVSGLSIPQTLAANQSLTFSVTFTPQAGGSASGNLNVISNASNPTLAIALSGSSSTPGQLSVSPGSISFGNIVVGQSATQTATLTATGSSVTVNSANLSSTEFTVSGISLPFTLNAGQSAAYSVKFTPRVTGTASATLAFSSNASVPTVSETLVGAGMTAPTHSVDVSWSASTSTVAGYNVYRGDQASGPFTKLNSALDATTSYNDTNVAAGRTYFYVATAVDASGAESGYSNAVSATIPTP